MRKSTVVSSITMLLCAMLVAACDSTSQSQDKPAVSGSEPVAQATAPAELSADVSDNEATATAGPDVSASVGPDGARAQVDDISVSAPD